MKALSVFLGSMVEARSLALSVAFAAVVFLFAGTTQSAHAADQIRFKVNNDAGFTIDRLVMNGMPYKNTIKVYQKLAESGADITQGKSGNVKFNLGNEVFGSSLVDFSYRIASSPQVGLCSKNIVMTGKNGQFSKAVMPDGTDVSGELDSGKDQIIRVRYKVVGAVQDRKCRYQGYKVYNR